MLADSLEINILEETEIKGQVICASTNKYTVCTENGNTVVISARGKIKYSKMGVLTGDFVEIADEAIIKVYPRQSRFLRPNVANVTALCITIACLPEPDYLILDKLLLAATHQNVQCCIAVNKSDINEGVYDYCVKNYSFLPIFSVSALTGDGMSALKDWIAGKTAVFAGQSAVGKTTILNSLLKTDFKTGALSEKLERGRHTTTGSRLIRSDDFIIVDTPGFSELEVDISPEEAFMNFPPYDKFLGQCRYQDCTHVNEPDCVIKQKVEQGELSKSRYERYIEIIKQIKEDYGKRYGKKH